MTYAPVGAGLPCQAPGQPLRSTGHLEMTFSGLPAETAGGGQLLLQVAIGHRLCDLKVELLRSEVLHGALGELVAVRSDRRGQVLSLSHRRGLGELKLEHLALQLLALEQIEEIGLTLPFRIDGDECASEGLEENADGLDHVRDGYLLHRFRLLLIQFDIVQSDQVIGRKHEVEIVGDHEAHRLDGSRFRELEPHFFSLLLLQEEESHLDVAYLHGKAGS
eukprot:CAMPEP_0170471384 /NCGR_PEP_ID=MMETSP0123-20130129/13609_1 /TAXON_ID=182087 /ORGANISM="Favella ehrenbergii, Strain Fehren 1" /LENGTH=219 /DNA_ID=CAMNT_0010738989 /DNA_START=1693 /DNA_END=2354 /DNA_ORIENTATION=-